jgi:hypothetical protein
MCYVARQSNSARRNGLLENGCMVRSQVDSDGRFAGLNRSAGEELMKLELPIRMYLGAALGLAAAMGSACAQTPRYDPPRWYYGPPRYYQPPQYEQPAREAPRYWQPPVARIAQNRGPNRGPGPNRAARPGLPLWMQRHQNLSPAQQQRELQNEEGFRALPPQEQQRELQELRRLQSMTPEQRGRREALLGMTPQQRQQFTAAVGQFTALPPDRRVLVKRAFEALRRVPVPERQAAMSTYPPLRQLSPEERQTLVNLLFWEPYFTAQEGPPQPGAPGR